MGLKKVSSDGPGLTDVALMMSAIEELHGVNVSVQMSVGGGLGVGVMEIVVMAIRKDAPSGAVPRSVSRRYLWPSSQNATVEGLLYRATHELDVDCGSMWFQEVFDTGA
jgi:hypothetical protein